MAYGYAGKVLHVDLSHGSTWIEQPGEVFYRRYVGGSAMGAYYLLHHTPACADPLGPDNTLSLFVGPATGAPISGQSRVAATAKSPLTDLVGESTSGGYWPAELKFAGFDGIVIRGRAPRPVLLWVRDGQVELRDARHLLRRFTAEVLDIIRQDLADDRARVLQCGPAAENGVRFSAVISNANRANGRSGLGLVLASKNLKAVAVRGHSRPKLADPDAVQALAQWGARHLSESGVGTMSELGTARTVLLQNALGGLPTRNWASGVFADAYEISGEKMAETIRARHGTCFGCVVRCKSVVEGRGGAFAINPRYGGPEYETLGMLGSLCGVADLEAVTRANQLCNMYGMDTISCGATIAWAMDCFERGLITTADTGGVQLGFGSSEALVHTVEAIGKATGFGRVLGQGSARAAKQLGVGEDLVVAVKGQELPAHMPQLKRSLALLYAINPGGADHTVAEHDPGYLDYPERMAALGLLDPEPLTSLSVEKVRYAVYMQRVRSFIDSACFCQFVFGPAWQLYDLTQMVETMRGVTGWNTSLWELMKVGERQLNLLRAFNSRDGAGAQSDALPAKLRVPLADGPSDGMALDEEELERAKTLYYQMVGWDQDGHPTRPKLGELALNWVADLLEADGVNVRSASDEE